MNVVWFSTHYRKETRFEWESKFQQVLQQFTVNTTAAVVEGNTNSSSFMAQWLSEDQGQISPMNIERAQALRSFYEEIMDCADHNLEVKNIAYAILQELACKLRDTTFPLVKLTIQYYDCGEVKEEEFVLSDEQPIFLFGRYGHLPARSRIHCCLFLTKSKEEEYELTFYDLASFMGTIVWKEMLTKTVPRCFPITYQIPSEVNVYMGTNYKVSASVLLPV
jgi:hypothetical protein